jgi:putative flippase GtrA
MGRGKLQALQEAEEAPDRPLGTFSRLARRLHLPTTLVKFLIVGGVGFCINQVFLFLFYDSPVFWFLPDQDTRVDLGLVHHQDIRLLISSIVAVEIAILCQFVLHERWTFRWRAREGWLGQRLIKFQISSIVSPVVIVATVNALTPELRDWAGDDSFIGTLAPYISNALGVGMGFIWNWTLNSLIIWPHQRKTEEERLIA